MTNRFQRHLASALLVVSLAACSSDATQAPGDSPTTQLLPTQIPTTVTPSPIATFNPDCPRNAPSDPPWVCRKAAASPRPADPGTALPESPTASPKPPPSALVAAAFGFTGGDGPIVMYDYIMEGSTLPSVVLYSDGLLLARDRERDWYLQVHLSPPYACRLVAELRALLMQAQEVSEFNGTPTPEFGFGNGEPGIYLRVAGTPQLGQSDSILAEPYRSSEFLAPIEHITGYARVAARSPYAPERMILWIENFNGWQHPYYNLWWPGWQTPVLAEILATATEHLVIVEGETAAALAEEIGYLPAVTLTQDDAAAGEKYVVLSRGLLPHESLAGIDHEDYGYVPYSSLDSDALQCDE